MQDFRKLKTWERAHQLTVAVYSSTKPFPKDEIYGLTSQIRRASASIPANIAEGCGTAGPADMARYLQHAMASACELEYHLLLARDLGLLPGETYKSLITEVLGVKKMLSTLITRVKAAKGGRSLTDNRQPKTENVV